VFVPLKKATKEGTLYFVHFNHDLRLSEVILGTRCTLSLQDVRDLTRARHPNAVVYGSRQADKYFAIVPDENTLGGMLPT
jgi:hypothetical protein